MKQTRTLVVAALAIAALAVGTPVRAQAGSSVTIDFPFTAAGQSMEAGSYNIETRPGGALVLHPRKGGQDSPMLTAVTRLARQAADHRSSVVFDKTDEGMVLSEIWLPNQDGYCLVATSKDHQHRVVPGKD